MNSSPFHFTKASARNTAIRRLVAGAMVLCLGFALSPTRANDTLPTAAVQPIPAPGSSAVPVAASYLLVPDDQLEIFVQGHDELHQTVTLLSDGTFDYPIVGKVQAAGKTVDQLTALLTEGVSGICKDPQVTVVVRMSHVQKISVAGSVKVPGLIDYHPGLRLMEVLAASGGLNDTPETTEATVATDGGAKTIPIDLVRLMKEGDASQNVMLAPGDIVLLSPRDPATSMIQVIGEVNKPGQFPVMTGGSTVLSLLTEAGGATPVAALTQVQLLHAGRVKDLDLYPLKYDLNDPAGKVLLVAGDTLLVPTNKQKIAVLGEVHAPAVYPIPDGESLPITQALATAGGPTDDGDKRQVGVLRLGPDHKRHLIEYNMDQLLKGDSTVADANLQNGDILVVPTRRHGHNFGDYLGQSNGLYALTHLFVGF